MKLQEFCKKIILYGIESGLDQVEAYGIQTDDLDISVFEHAIEACSMTFKQEVYIRGTYKRGIGEYHIEECDEKLICEIIDTIKNMASVVSASEELILYPPGAIYANMDIYSKHLQDITIQDNIAMAVKLEKEIVNEGIEKQKFVSCNIITSNEEVVIENSLGLSLQSKANAGLMSCNVVLDRKGERVSNYEVTSFNDPGEFDFRKFSENIIKNTKQKFNSVSIPSARISVILRHDAMACILAAFSAMFCADQVQLGLSPLMGKEGETIFSTLITIEDDPFGKFNARNFDGEGVPTKRVAIVKKGTLETFMYDQKTAQKAGKFSTGHAIRGAGGNIYIGPSNLYIQAGETPFEKLISKMDLGVMVTNISDSYVGADLISGDFAFPCEGILIQNGKENKSIKEIVLVGNFIEILKNVISVGNDLETCFEQGVFGSPSIYVGKLNIVGKKSDAI